MQELRETTLDPRGRREKNLKVRVRDSHQKDSHQKNCVFPVFPLARSRKSNIINILFQSPTARFAYIFETYGSHSRLGMEMRVEILRRFNWVLLYSGF